VLKNWFVLMSTTSSSDDALYSETDRALFLALIACSFVAVVLIVRRWNRKGPPVFNNVVSRGDIVTLSQEKVVRVDHCDLERRKIIEYYCRLFPGRVFLPSFAANDFDEGVGVPLHGN
jgi:hypothetical protein